MPGHRPEAIANAFLGMAGGAGRLTQIHIQKLVYIAHGWMLGLSGEPLVNCEPEAWDRGPVFTGLREYIKMAGSSPIKRQIRENDRDPRAFLGYRNPGRVISAHLGDYEEKVMDRVWAKYGRMNAFRLTHLTHLPETPWSKVYNNGWGRNELIPDDVTKEYYKKLAQDAKKRTS
ncbi:MAG: DUF4065 domain-containing protein [Hyphomonadaceae bacterium]|nr:DUF4065 domain-containing protein [Hyphomonadaceae bacterium]